MKKMDFGGYYGVIYSNIKYNQLENEIKALKNDKNTLFKQIKELENKINIHNKEIDNLKYNFKNLENSLYIQKGKMRKMYNFK